MKLLILMVICVSCAMPKVKSNEKPRIITKTVVVEKTIPFQDLRAKCLKDFYQLGMKSEEAIQSCTFVEQR